MQARASNIRARIQSLPLGSAFRLAWLTTPILCASPVYHSSGSIAGPHRESYSYAIPRRGLVRRATDFGEGGSVRRAYLWSHHIYAKKKKREIPELAKKLGLTGFCSTGKPGFIVVEGDEANVKRFLSTVKRWPWQRHLNRSHLSVGFYIQSCFQRLIVRIQEDSEKGRAFGNFQMTGAGGGEKNDLKEVRQIMDQAGVGEHFETVAGIQTSSGNKDSNR
ncbi:hypothetical protein AAMO2058_001577400 [Amorphochlora amoebiformis]